VHYFPARAFCYSPFFDYTVLLFVLIVIPIRFSSGSFSGAPDDRNDHGGDHGDDHKDRERHNDSHEEAFEKCCDNRLSLP
jgi:hypothetical protein